jgi:hypothetical protein
MMRHKRPSGGCQFSQQSPIWTQERTDSLPSLLTGNGCRQRMERLAARSPRTTALEKAVRSVIWPELAGQRPTERWSTASVSDFSLLGHF